MVLIKKSRAKSVCRKRGVWGRGYWSEVTCDLYIVWWCFLFVFFGQRFFLDQLKSLKVELKTTFELLTYFIPIINIVDHVLIVIE